MSVRYDISRRNEAATRPVPTLFHWDGFLSWLRPHCPDCKGEMIFRYKMPEDYQEVSPKYYECSCCKARYMRVNGGKWISAASADCDRIYSLFPR